MFKMIFLITAWVMMWKIITSENMILEGVGKWGERMAKRYPIFDGLIVCEWCLPNIHGILFVYPLAFGLRVLCWWHWEYVLMYPFVLGASSFICGNLWAWYLRNNAKKDLYEAQKAYYEKAEYKLFLELNPDEKNVTD